MLHVYNYVVLKMSTWCSKHVEENSILWINNNQCIKLVINVWSIHDAWSENQKNIKLLLTCTNDGVVRGDTSLANKINSTEQGPSWDAEESCSWSRNSPAYTYTAATASLPCSRDPSTGPYPSTGQSTPLQHPYSIFLNNSSEPTLIANKDLTDRTQSTQTCCTDF